MRIFPRVHPIRNAKLLLVNTVLALWVSPCLGQIPGQPDPGFLSDPGADGYIWAMETQADGKVVIGGEFNSYELLSMGHIGRLNADGTPDPSFLSQWGANGTVQAIQIQEDGKVLIGGDFLAYQGLNVHGLARLNSNGTLDFSFLNSGGTTGSVWVIHLQSDGKILVGGDFSDFNGESKTRLVRLLPDGELDPDFAEQNPNDWIRTIETRKDGRILIGGDFTTYNGIPANYLIQLLENGEPDPEFQTGTGFNERVRDICLLDDQKALVVGGFTTYQNTTCTDVVRLLENGDPDPAFSVGQGPKGWVVSCSPRPDGQIFLGGDFTQFGNEAIARFITVDTSGTPVAGYGYGSGPSGTVRLIRTLPNGDALVAGGFTSINGQPCDRIAILHGTPITTGLDPIPNLDEKIAVGTSTSNHSIHVTFTDLTGSGKIFLITSSGSILRAFSWNGEQEVWLEVASAMPGMYFIQFESSLGTSIHPVVLY